MTCKSEEYRKGNRCCDRCPAGSYVLTECDDTKKTECAECAHDFYTATINHRLKCLSCKKCSLIKNGRTLRDCTATKDTECVCVPGFFCYDESCSHCYKVTNCPPGEGVKVKATHTNNTICAACEDGTYSNVTDFLSPCKTHTRCEELGRVLKTPGTSTADAICGDFKTHCHWIIPAGLWSGLVLTALVLFGLICWRTKRRSSRAVCHRVPVSLTEIVPAKPICHLELPLPLKEQNGHCTESCMEESFKLPLYTPDDSAISYCTEDKLDSSPPTPPAKVFVSFEESTKSNGNAGFCAGNFLRAHSEPQEDEWCGTEAS